MGLGEEQPFFVSPRNLCSSNTQTKSHLSYQGTFRHLFLALGLCPFKLNSLPLLHTKLVPVQPPCGEHFLCTKMCQACQDTSPQERRRRESLQLQDLQWVFFLGFPPSSGRQQGFCMMCIMEAHVRKVLYSSATAIRPRAVIRDLKCKQCFNRVCFLL